MNDEIDPAIIAVLAQLWRARQESPAQAWSLAKLAKQSGLAMSTLTRILTGLSAADLVTVDTDGPGTGRAALNQAGEALCRAVFPVP